MKFKQKEPSMRGLIIQALENSPVPLDEFKIRVYVIRKKGLISIKKHSFISALSKLKTAGKIEQVKSNGRQGYLWTLKK